ncbi:MAG: helix-turn-helix transcriptional regulator [Cyclobacteriaceae bacterium]
MKNQTNLAKLKKFESKDASGWAKKAEWRSSNESWLDASFRIAVEILEALRVQKMTQKDLAEKVGVSAQQINKIVKGTENLTLETIYKIEEALGIKLMDNLVSYFGHSSAKFNYSSYGKIHKSGLSYSRSYPDYQEPKFDKYELETEVSRRVVNG